VAAAGGAWLRLCQKFTNIAKLPKTERQSQKFA
jgi:hypothetical protein